MESQLPRIRLVFGLSQCDKYNHASREGLRGPSLPRSIASPAFIFLVESVSNKKRILLSVRWRAALLKLQHWPVYLMLSVR
jgi:hypothetical protein